MLTVLSVECGLIDGWISGIGLGESGQQKNGWMGGRGRESVSMGAGTRFKVWDWLRKEAVGEASGVGPMGREAGKRQ